VSETKAPELADAWPRIERWLLGLSGLGFAASVVLEVVHAQTYLAPARDSFCSLGARFDCVSVAASGASVFLGVPWALWGVAGFMALAAAVVRRSIWLLPLAIGAALTSVLLLILEIREIGSICLFCEIAHGATWLIAVLAVFARGSLRRDMKSGTTLYWVFVPGLTLGLTAALFLPPYWAAFSYRSAPPFATGTTPEGQPWIGAREPRLVIHEFTDYRCPHCRAATTRTLRWLDERPGLRIVRHQQPNSACHTFGPTCEAVRLAYCAEEQGKFWRADRWLFSHAQGGRPVNRAELGRDLDLEVAKLEACSQRADVYERAAGEHRYAKKMRILDVPGYLVEGKRLRPHQLEDRVRQLLR